MRGVRGAIIFGAFVLLLCGVSERILPGEFRLRFLARKEICKGKSIKDLQQRCYDVVLTF